MSVIDQCVTDKFAVFNGDCVEVMKDIAGASIHRSVYYPPFVGL